MSGIMNLPAASGRGILMDSLYLLRRKQLGIKPKEIKTKKMWQYAYQHITTFKI